MLLAARGISLRLHKGLVGNRWIGIFTGLTLLGIALAILGAIYRIPFAVDSLPPHPLGFAIALMLTGGLASFILGVWRRSNAAVVVNVLTILAAIAIGLTGASSGALDGEISARQIAQSPASANASVYMLSRSFQYAVNFYQHREVLEWNPQSSEPGRVFAQPARIRELRMLGLKCPEFPEHSALVICEDTGLVDRLPRGGKPQ